MLPLPILTTTTPLMSEMLMMIFAVMMHKKTLLPWQEEQGGTQSQEETRKLRDTIKQKDQQIVLLEKENAELKSTKTIYVTQIEHVNTYVQKTDVVMNCVEIKSNNDKTKIT